MQFTMHIMLKNMLNIEPEDPRASQMLEDYNAYMKGLVSIPINLPGSPYNKALKVHLFHISLRFFNQPAGWLDYLVTNISYG